MHLGVMKDLIFIKCQTALILKSKSENHKMRTQHLKQVKQEKKQLTLEEELDTKLQKLIKSPIWRLG